MFDSVADDIRQQIRYGNMAIRLIIICSAIYLVLALTYLSMWGFQLNGYDAIINWIGVPMSFKGLLFKPWTLLTYMFTHFSFGHVLGNMIWLYVFGNIFMILMPRDKMMLGLFIGGSIVGALLAITFISIVPVLKSNLGAPMVGASAGVMAIVFATATISPHYKIRLFFLGDVSIMYIALFSFISDFLFIPFGNAGGMLAHIGGALFGFSYVKLLQSGTDFFSPFYNIIPFIKNLGRHRLKVSHKQTQKGTSAPTPPPVKNEQSRIDEILDKINRSGYDSLSKEEKEFLFHYSNRK